MGKDQELLEAARSGNIAIVEKLLIQKSKRSGPLASLRRGPGANAQDSSGYSALHHAALHGHADIVHVLLAYDASANLPDARGSSPLHLASWAGHQEIVNMLVTHPHRPANPNQQTTDLQTPLHCAAQHGHTGALTTLLAHGADPNLSNNRGETPLDLAAQYGRLQAVQMLIRAHPELLAPFRAQPVQPAQHPRNRRRGNRYAADDGDELDGLAGGATAVAVGGRIFKHSPLHLASRNGHRAVVEVLLAAGVNVNLLTAAGTALHEAALCGKDAVVRCLLEAGADLETTDATGRTALDLLEEFPPHVTRGIVTVINNHRNSMAFESDSDDPEQRNGGHRVLLGSSYKSRHQPDEEVSPQHYWAGNHDCISPSSSLGSLDPSTPSPRPRAATTGETPGYYVTMAPISSKVSPTPPKKPPRRNLSVSPTHLMSTSMDAGYAGGGGCGGSSSSSSTTARGAHNTYEHMFLARSGGSNGGNGRGTSDSESPAANGDGGGSGGKMRAYSIDQYVKMSRTGEDAGSAAAGAATGYPQPAPRNLKAQPLQQTSNYENMEVRSYNPHRKLRRSRDNYGEQFNIDRATITAVPANAAPAHRAPAVQPITPLSPTHYVQPPTPEHPPPNALQAERCIHERIRPLSQEYKRRSAGLQLLQQQQQEQLLQLQRRNDASPSAGGQTQYDNRIQQSSLGASSGSLSSSVSLSDRSASTDCVEEFVGDAPFAGLFKGSTMALNVNTNQQTYLNNYNNSTATAAPMSTFGAVQRRAERPTSLFRPPSITTTQHSAASSAHGDCPPKSEATGNSATNATQLSAFDEQEEWAKISEIMATFGTDAIQDSAFATDEERRKAHQATIARRSKLQRLRESSSAAGVAVDVAAVLSCAGSQPEPELTLITWLDSVGVGHLEAVLQRNGFDDVEFLHGILERSDLLALDISPTDADAVMAALDQLKRPQTFDELQRNENNNQPEAEKPPAEVTNGSTPKTVHFDDVPGLANGKDAAAVGKWLASIHLQEYEDVFRRHLYTEMDRVRQVWEVELQAVLEIAKPGHRKRILHSIGGNQHQQPAVVSQDGASSNAGESGAAVSVARPVKPAAAVGVLKPSNGTVPRTNHGKNRMAPQPPGKQASSVAAAAAANLEIRTPAELLLGVPVGLQTTWRHMPADLLAGRIQYEVNYLGSTVVKELRGTESTRKSIQKLKRGGELRLEAANNAEAAAGRPIPVATKRPLKLSISHRGVLFIDIASQGTICEHEIRNIDCACQDSDDLSHFAYITKDVNLNTHYCHVFNVDSMDLATTIILTLGQAFEVAYQLALRESAVAVSSASATTPLRSPMNGGGIFGNAAPNGHHVVAATAAAAGPASSGGAAAATNGIKL